jgi:hypothetical protein
VNRFRGILECLLRVLTLAALILLLLCLNLRLTLLCKEDLLVRLILLVTAHEFIEFLLRILDLGHQVLTGIPRKPRTDLADVEIVLGVLALEDLRHHLRLLHGRKAATNLHTTHIGLELHRVVILLLALLLVLEKEDLILLLEIGLANLLVADLPELGCVGKQVVNLESVLLGKECHEVLETLDLPIIVLELHELAEHESVLVLDDLLGRDERYDAILLGRDLGVLIEVVNVSARIINGRESFTTRHFIDTRVVFESPFYAGYKCTTC